MVNKIMEKPVAAVEFGSKKMKLVVGYELDGQVYVIYSLVRPYGYIIENGDIIDPTRIIQSMKEIKNFSDPSSQLKLNIGEVLVALPPYGLKIYTSQTMTTAGGEDGKISVMDIRNVHAQIRNSALPNNNALVDIVPVFYELNQGRKFTNPPLGESSSTVKIAAMVHTLPKRIPDSYDAVVTPSGINVKRNIVSSYGASMLLSSYPDIPNNYLLVDIGSTMTTVSLVGEKRLYGSTYFSWGGDKITERIIESFNIGESEAEKIKMMYGIDNREMNFKAPVCRSSDGEGNEIKHYTDELNEIIKSELSSFVKDLNASIGELLKEYDLQARALPMVLVGGGSQLYGLKEFIEPKVQSEQIIIVTPRNLGARDATFTNVLGLILANQMNPSVYDDSHPRVGQVTRDEK